METVLFWVVPFSSLLALLLALFFYRQMMKESEGTPVMKKSPPMCGKAPCLI